jgi:hypothetical protein
MSLEMVCIHQQKVIDRQSEMIKDLLQEVAQFREVTKEEANYLEARASESWDSVSK